MAHREVLGDTNHGGSRVAVKVVLSFLNCIKKMLVLHYPTQEKIPTHQELFLGEETVAVLMASLLRRDCKIAAASLARSNDLS
jgi:hypothetical protein